MIPEKLYPEFHCSLLGLNTFGMDVKAECMVTISKLSELLEIMDNPEIPRPLRVLGGGSNVLIKEALKGTILINRIKGIEKIQENEAFVWLRVGGGEVWQELVMYVIKEGWGGIENLALIPGTVGAAPIQNIGAYGVEVKDTILEVSFWNWETRTIQTYSNAACCFGYRDSLFKHQLKGKGVVTAVTFRLNKAPVFKTEYGAIADELKAMNSVPSVQSIAQAVMHIRRSKLPDPSQIGNAGSFFKNPSILQTTYNFLRKKFPEIPAYPASEGLVKVPAGWLIEQCGWKGYREGDAGVHAKQALVLVNYGAATGQEIWDLSTKVLESVSEKFGIDLEREVQVW